MRHDHATVILAKLLLSASKESRQDVERFTNMVFQDASPTRLDEIVVRFFGLIKTYFQVLADEIPRNEVESLWLTLWSEWQSISGMPSKVKEFELLNSPMRSAIRGVFMDEMTSKNQSNETRQSVVAIASATGTASVLPVIITFFFRFALDAADQQGIHFLRERYEELLGSIVTQS